jgi:hypothetical protein
MISDAEVRTLLAREPKFDDMICSLRAISKQPKRMLHETKEVVALARKFNGEVVIPFAAELDRRVQQNPDYLPREFIEIANRWGLYTMWIPKIFGGRGYNLPDCICVYGHVQSDRCSLPGRRHAYCNLEYKDHQKCIQGCVGW